MTPPSRAAATVFGVADLVVAALVALGVFGGLPARVWYVDSLAIVVIATQAAAGVGLLSRARWGPVFGCISAAIALVLGLLLVGSLALSVGFLSGIYGPLGKGGSIIFILVIALVVPYVVALPCAQLYWLLGRLPHGPLIAWAVLVPAASLGLRSRLALSIDAGHPAAIVLSAWRSGQLVGRAVARSKAAGEASLASVLGEPGSELVEETIVAQGPVVRAEGALFALSVVAGHDGVGATLFGRTAYATPDDLLRLRAYDRGTSIAGYDVPVGADTSAILALLAERLGVPARQVTTLARVFRFRTVRSTPRRAEPAWTHVDESSLTPEVAGGALRDAARYLARNISTTGRFRYLVDAVSGRAVPGYDWPRHAGATYFLAQAASRFHEPELAEACLRAAALVRDEGVTRCGDEACVGDGDRVDLGSSALAAIAFAEIVRTGLDPTYDPLARRLASFVRAQQRPDGEFMHEYDRVAERPVDVQYPYYSGEATLALARVHRISDDAADLSAATRALAHLVGPAWSFFGSRYYFGEEHWTCQAMAELWDRSPDEAALDFCVRWQAYGRAIQQRRGESVYDSDGAIGVGPVFVPRLTPVASRAEAGVATLAVLRGIGAAGLEPIESQQKRALALLVRRQLRPGPDAIFADPPGVYGGMPGSEVDLFLRIDYAQHMGSALMRWLQLDEDRGHS